MTSTRCTVSEVSASEFPDVVAVNITKVDNGDTRIEFLMASADCGGVPFVACVANLAQLVEHCAAELEAKGSVCVPVSVMEDGDDDGTARPN